MGGGCYFFICVKINFFYVFFVFLYVLFIVEEGGRHGLLSSIFLATDSELNSREKKKGKEQTDVLQKSNKVRITSLA